MKKKITVILPDLPEAEVNAVVERIIGITSVYNGSTVIRVDNDDKAEVQVNPIERKKASSIDSLNISLADSLSTNPISLLHGSAFAGTLYGTMSSFMDNTIRFLTDVQLNGFLCFRGDGSVASSNASLAILDVTLHNLHDEIKPTFILIEYFNGTADVLHDLVDDQDYKELIKRF